MTVDPSLTLSFALPVGGPLVASASLDGSPLGIIEYTPPALQARVVSIGEDHVHGDVPLRWSWQQALLGMTLYPIAPDEPTVQSTWADLAAAVSQGLRFEVTETISDAPAKVWICNPGSLTPTGRTRADLRHNCPVWSLTLPCHPIPGEVT